MLNTGVPPTISLSGHNVPTSHDFGIQVAEVFYVPSPPTRERSCSNPIALVSVATVQSSEDPCKRLNALHVSKASHFEVVLFFRTD